MSFDPVRAYKQKRAQAHEERAEAIRLQNAEDAKERARVAFCDAGGSDEEFDDSWPEIRARLLIDETAQTMRGRK